jgi:hypothetical protein
LAKKKNAVNSLFLQHTWNCMWRSPGAAKKGLAEWESQVTSALLFLDLQRQGLKGGEATKAVTGPAFTKKRMKKKSG